MFTRRSLFVGASLLTLLAACDRHPTAPATKDGVIAFGGSAANGEVTNAVYTITNSAVDGTGHCLNGPEGTQNCNLYDAKEHVWLGGEGVHNPNQLPNGRYFFAVLQPGGQQSPNDASAETLSDTSVTTNTGAGDAYTNRIFTLTDGEITYFGTHDFDNNKIRLFPYDNTPNPGGEYIMAVCSLKDGYPVHPDNCKYDAFKVKLAEPPADANALTVSKTAAGTDTRTYHWSIAKDADKTMIKSSNGTATFNYSVTVTRDAGAVSNVHVTGTITVTNPNTGAVAVTGISDVLSDGTVCAIANAPTSFPAGATTLSYSCDPATLPAQPLSNTATITWAAQDVGGHAMAAGSATTTVSDIAFTETAVDASVTVGDTFGALGTTDATKTFTYSKTFEGNAAGTCTTHDNTATFTTNNTGATGTASKSVKVCVGVNLTASKTAAPAFTRTYAWNVGKAVDKTVVKQIGGSATFNYTVNAAQTGSTDGSWTVTGAITVTNPNDWETVTVNLGDAIDNGGSCTVAGGSSVAVPASSSVSRNYTCTYAAAPAPAAYTNTVTASWSASDAGTPDGSATGTASGAFGDPTTRLNTTAMITDTFNGTPTTLGTLTASDVAPAAQTWTYSHTVPVTVNACVNYLNTAAYTTNNSATGSANVAVQVCGNISGGLTIGFWQNKNGQAIINGDATTAGACNVAGYLRGYAPFQDLSATATCANVASYAMNIIKAANASGASMNAMLKAQMLATALDVYFSTNGLGGNKIASPVALGGVKIDLTSICSSITNCANTYANVSAAFNGATSLTVNQILAYAASQSNAGGSAWYGQVKTVQELAKNTFDAINNSVAIVAP